MTKEKLFSRIHDLMDKLGKPNVILMVILILVLVITGLYQTFSLYTSSGGVSLIDGIKTYQFILGASDATSRVTIGAGTSKNIAITVTNKEKIKLLYGIYYSSSNLLEEVELGYIPSSAYPGTGLIEGKSDYVVTTKIYNHSSNDVTIDFGIHYGLENGGSLALEENQKFLDVIYPYQYQVEYLESTGTQYIDTGIAPSNMNIKTEVKYQYMDSRVTVNDSIIGSRNVAANTRYYPSSLGGSEDRHVYGSSGTTDWGGGTLLTTNDYAVHTVIFNDDSHNCYVDGTLLGNLGTSFVPHHQNLYLFGLNAEGHVDYQSVSKIYYCKIWDNGTLVRDFIPVVDREGIPCLYDKVSGELYYDDGESNVSFKTDLNPSLYKYSVEYLESTGTQYIDTGVAPSNMNIQVELQYQYMSTDTFTSSDSVMGSRDGGANTRFYPSSLNQITSNRHVYGTTEHLSNFDTLKHIILFNDASHNIYLDGNLVRNLNATYTPHHQPMYLFGLNTEGTFSYQSASRVYYCKIWDNGTLVRDFIPVIDWEGVPCLYDKVNDKLYYNMDTSGPGFYTNFITPKVIVDKNTQVTESKIREINHIPSEMAISNIKIYDSSNHEVGGNLTGYDAYKVTYDLNRHAVEQQFFPKPPTSITLANGLSNPGFESELSNYYNNSAFRSSDVKKNGNYSMYFNCAKNQVFLRMLYGDIGMKGKSLYVRAYARTDNTSLNPGIYVYEKANNVMDYSNEAVRYNGWIGKDKPYYNWARISQVTSPTASDYNYLMLQISQSNGEGEGNVYWDDFMAVVLDSNVWGTIPTTAWMDEMVTDFTGTKTFSW